MSSKHHVEPLKTYLWIFAILMFLFSLSNTLETYAMGRTHASIRALLDMAPKEAEVYRGG